MTEKRRRPPQPPAQPAGSYDITLRCPICEHYQREAWPSLRSPSPYIKCDGCGHLVADMAWALVRYRFTPSPPGA